MNDIQQADDAVVIIGSGAGGGTLAYEAVGWIGAHRTPPYPATHNMGTSRMSARPEDGGI